MTRKQIAERFERCCAKAFDGFPMYHATLDEDEEADLLIDGAGRIFLFEQETPYTAADVQDVKYYRDLLCDDIDEGENHIRLRFQNGDQVMLEAYGVCHAYLGYGQRRGLAVYQGRGAILEVFDQMLHLQRAVELAWAAVRENAKDPGTDGSAPGS